MPRPPIVGVLSLLLLAASLTTANGQPREVDAALLAEVPPHARLLPLPRTGEVVATWRDEEGRDHAAVSRDGRRFQRSGPIQHALTLRAGRFDPLREAPPLLPHALRAQTEEGSDLSGGALIIVQFITQPMEAYRLALTDLGATIAAPLAHHAAIVHLPSPALREALSELPFVRWVGDYHAGYRLEAELQQMVSDASPSMPPIRCRLHLTQRDTATREAVRDRLTNLGARVHDFGPAGIILEATLNRDQLLAAAHDEAVLWIDRWHPPESDMDQVRIFSGANYVLEVGGFSGHGVRAEVKDGNIAVNHLEFAHRPPLIRTSLSGGQNHGTSTYGIIFAAGVDPAARGVLFNAEQGIFSSYHNFGNRFTHTAQLLEPPYEAVFQSNSWGSGLTTQYNSFSAEMDDIILHLDLTILQSQSNTGNRSSRPQAWAKNIVSVGGIRHYNSLNLDQHAWAGTASIGLAEDGRIKPDLAHFNDWIYTTVSNNGYTQGFGGTSAATPITAGHFGLMYEMWNAGLFGNEVDPSASLFANRPRAATAKALMINTAESWSFNGEDHDLTRAHQGWGRADVKRLYELRDRIFVVNADDPLTNLEERTYSLFVEPGTEHLRATLVYLDPPGTTSSTKHRVNGVALRVESPAGLTYHGNNGLLTGNRSAIGGEPMLIDTVQNVRVMQPQSGWWHISVDALEVVQDAVPELPGTQVAFALVVSGVLTENPCFADLTGSGEVGLGDLLVLLAAWGPLGPDELGHPADLDGDGAVDLADLLLLLGAWGACAS